MDDQSGLIALFLAKTFFIGVIGFLIILIFHGYFLTRISATFEAQEEILLVKKKYNRILFNFYLSFVLIATLHLLEIMIWSFALTKLKLVGGGFSHALLFAGSCYATLGFVPNILQPGWKALAFFISFSGLFTMAWTTSTMVSMMAAYKLSWTAKNSAKFHK